MERDIKLLGLTEDELTIIFEKTHLIERNEFVITLINGYIKESKIEHIKTYLDFVLHNILKIDLSILFSINVALMEVKDDKDIHEYICKVMDFIDKETYY